MDNMVVSEELIFSLQKGGTPGNVIEVVFAKAFDMLD